MELNTVHENLNRICAFLKMRHNWDTVPDDGNNCMWLLNWCIISINVGSHETFPFNPILYIKSKDEYNEMLEYCKLNFHDTIKEKVYKEEIDKVTFSMKDAQLLWQPSFTFEFSNRIWEVNNQ